MNLALYEGVFFRQKQSEAIQNRYFKRRINTASTKRISSNGPDQVSGVWDVEVAMTPNMTSALLKVTGFIMVQPTTAEETSARPYVPLADWLHQS